MFCAVVRFIVACAFMPSLAASGVTSRLARRGHFCFRFVNRFTFRCDHTVCFICGFVV